MFTLTGYLKKVREETTRILREADAIRSEKGRLTKPLIEKVEKRFFQNPDQVKQLYEFIKNKELPFIENVRKGIKNLIGKQYRIVRLLEKAGKKELVVDVEWLWNYFKKIKPEIINIHSWVRREEEALKKDDFKQFVKIHDLERNGYSKIYQIISQYPKIGLDIYRKNKDNKVVLLSRIGGSPLKRVAAMVMIALSCVTAQAATYTKPDEMNVTNKVGDIYSFSQEEGEKRLIELANVSDKEDSWVYIKKKKGKSFWLDIGTIEGVGTSAHIRLVLKYLSEGDEITFYHTHPFILNAAWYEPEHRKHFEAAGGKMFFLESPSPTDYKSDTIRRRFFEKIKIIVADSAVAIHNGIFRYRAPLNLNSKEQAEADWREIMSLYANQQHNGGGQWKVKMQQKEYYLSFEPK